MAGKFREGIERESDTITVLASGDHWLYSNFSLSFASSGKYEQALEAAEKIVELKPDWLKGYKRLGDAYRGLRRYEEAIDAYKRGLEVDQEILTLREDLGNAARETSKFREAIEYVSDAIILAPENPCLLWKLEDAEKTVKLKPDWWEDYLRLGDAHRSLRRYEEAINAFKRELEVDPENIGLRKDLGSAAYLASKFGEANEHEMDAITLAPENHLLYSTDAYKRGLEFNRESIELIQELGIAAHDAGKFLEAIEHESNAIILFPEDHLLYNNRSLSYASFGKYKLDLEDAKKIV
ncbi:hypothetical protein R1sor_011961 [Riccia sorocarpa]|uniref:Tetratricopeptide repeat protein n=1 Tax=Riccia sorocarpa TaxID=122646 RepID=A0ABD3I620_9MARC